MSCNDTVLDHQISRSLLVYGRRCLQLHLLNVILYQQDYHNYYIV